MEFKKGDYIAYDCYGSTIIGLVNCVDDEYVYGDIIRGSEMKVFDFPIEDVRIANKEEI